MTIGIVARQEDPASLSDKTPQTEITASPQACVDVIQLLREGRALLPGVNPSLNPDLSTYLFKQPNEGETLDDLPTRLDTTELGAMRPGLYGQRGNRTSDRTADTAGTEMLERPAYFSTLQDVFGNSRYFDLVRNHNQVISTEGGGTIAQLSAPVPAPGGETIEAARRAIQEDPNAPTVLLNFDSHSDMYAGSARPNEESIAQWVNSVIATNPNVNEVYWVLPQDFRDNPEYNAEYINHQGPQDSQDRVFVQSPRDVTLYFNPADRSLSTTRPADYSPEKYRQIELHKRTIDELPNFQGQRTAVSIDLDYFDNRGYDTSYGAEVNYRGEEGFARFADGLRDANIRPVFTTVSASPEYVREGHMRDLLGFSTLVAEASAAATDAVIVPGQNHAYAGQYNRNSGIQVDRRGNPDLELLYGLFQVDSRSATPNDSIDLNLDNAETRAALDATRRTFGLSSNEEARTQLRRMDRADGNENGIIEFEAIESLIVRVCQAAPQPEPQLRKDYTQ